MGIKRTEIRICDLCGTNLAKTEIIECKLLYQSNSGTDASGNRSLGDDYMILEVHQDCFMDWAKKMLLRYVPEEAVKELRINHAQHAKIV